MIGVIGAGSWGSALALHLAKSGHPVSLWGHGIEHTERENPLYLPGVTFSDNMQWEEDLATILKNNHTILLAVPSHAFREVLKLMKPFWHEHHRLLSVTKGFDLTTHALLDTVVTEVLGEEVNFAVLSGPSFAKEVASGLPTAVVVASHDENLRHEFSTLFSHHYFRVYTSTDLVGVQIGGAIKNVLAIAAGLSDGMGFGMNARCALITRGLSELIQLGSKMGGQVETFVGLSGLGDLILTCSDDQSRNRRFGLALGHGETIEKALKSIGQVVEGLETVKHAKFLSEKWHIDMPIVNLMYAILEEGLHPKEALTQLFSRELKAE
jgi:glycerol-3-phosphate dehydrogenase (NAD(P)+)